MTAVFERMWTNQIFRVGAGCGIEIRGGDLVVVAVKSRPRGVTVLGRTVLADFRRRPPQEWGAEYDSFLKGCGLSHLSAAVGLPRDDVILRQIQLPPVSGKELAAAIGYQLDTLHPFENDEVYYAFAPLKGGAEGKEQLTVAVVIAEKANVDAYAGLFEAAGIPVSTFTVSGAAFYAGVRVRWDAAPRPFLIADVQGDHLEVYGESTERPFFSAEFDLQRVPAERALQLARADLRLSESEPASLTVCGEAGAEPGAPGEGRLATPSPPGFEPRTVAELLPAPLASPSGFDLRRDTLALSTALEAACPRLGWRTNLLPVERRKTSSRWMYVPTAALAAALLLLAVAFSLRPLIQDRNYVAAMEREMARLDQIVRQVQDAEQQTDLARQRVALLGSLRGRTEADLRILSELSRVLPDTVWLSALEINDNGAQLTGEAQAAAPVLGIINSSTTLANAAFTTSLVETEAGQRFQIAAERQSGPPAGDAPVAESVVAAPRAPQAPVTNGAGTLSPLGEDAGTPPGEIE